MRYPHTYSLMVILSIFLAVALSGCHRASIRPNPAEPPLAEIPFTIIDVTPEDYEIQAPSVTKKAEETENKQTTDAETPEQSTDTQETVPANTSEATPKAEEKPEEPSLESLIAPIYFALDDYSVQTQDSARLYKLAERLNLSENQNLRLRIEGHCDDRGTREYNFALGERRAAAIAAVLKKYGVDKNRIMTISYGKERPVALGQSEAIRAQNRRGKISLIMNAN